MAERMLADPEIRRQRTKKRLAVILEAANALNRRFKK